jgi:zinc transport system ATP-binding protein
VLKIENLFFAYENENILEDITFECDKSDFLAVVGPNGGGKSTLLRLILGLLKPTSGKITLSCPKLSYVPQDTLVGKEFPITALDAVLTGRLGKGFGFYSKQDKQDALLALEKTRMENFARKKIGDLSGGQRQRVFIARALMCESEMLILDEPTASIDMKGQIQIYDLLKELNRSKGVIIVSHDINMALGYATKIAYLNKTLFMHEPSAFTKELFFDKLRDSDSHNCPVDVAMANVRFCECEEHSQGQSAQKQSEKGRL